MSLRVAVDVCVQNRYVGGASGLSAPRVLVRVTVYVLSYVQQYFVLFGKSPRSVVQRTGDHGGIGSTLGRSQVLSGMLAT